LDFIRYREIKGILVIWGVKGISVNYRWRLFYEVSSTCRITRI